MDYSKLALQKHKELKGKLQINLKDSLDSREKLSIYYTPGVGAVSRHLALHPEEVGQYTWTNNLVAVISDGSAVLGLGNVGPEAALPVMEGKAMLFKYFGDIDAVPIVLNVHTKEEIINAVEAIAPSFGGINLEDIAAPICFEIEEALKKKLKIPVMHDDQHGSAVVALAAMINSSKLTRRKMKDIKIVVAGAGAAGVAIAKLLYLYAKPNIIVVDSKGALSKDRKDLNPVKKELLKITNKSGESGSLADVIKGADAFIGVTVGNILSKSMVRSMAKDPVIIAMANPDPEILPEDAKEAGAYIVATGRSDFPNQINNSMAFPGIFRGALDHKVSKITDAHKIAAAEAIAALVDNPTPDNIVPSMLDKRLMPAVAAVIK